MLRSLPSRLLLPAAATLECAARGCSVSLQNQAVHTHAASFSEQRSQGEASTSAPSWYAQHGLRSRITKKQMLENFEQSAATQNGLYARLTAQQQKESGAGSDDIDHALFQQLAGSHATGYVSPQQAELIQLLRRHTGTLPGLRGQTVLAVVLRVANNHVLVDPAFYSVTELAREDVDISHVRTAASGAPIQQRKGVSDVRVGDIVAVKVDSLYTPYGDMQLEGVKRDPVLKQRVVWEELATAFASKKPVFGRVLNQTSGGYAVGIAGFVALLPYARATGMTAQRIGTLEAFVIEDMDEKRMRIVVRDAKQPSGRRTAVSA